MIGLGIGIGLTRVLDAALKLSTLVRSLGGSLYLPSTSVFENTTVSTGIDDPAEIDDPIAYCGDLTTYNLSENMLINSVFAGASAGVAPTGYTVGTTFNGLTETIISAGVSSLTIRISGTASSTTSTPLLRRTSGLETTAKPGEFWSAQGKIAVVSGSLPANKLRIQLLETNAGDNGIASASAYFTDDATKVASKVFAEASVVRAKMYLIFDYTNGETYDFTITISNMQLERGRARDYVPTTTAAISRGTFNPAFQTTTANKPLLKQTSGKYNLLFDNSNDYLQTPARPSSAGYLCVAARSDAIGAVDTLIGAYKDAVTIQAGLALAINATGNAVLTRCAADGTTDAATTSTTLTAGVPAVIDADWTASSASVRINGAGEGTSAVTKDPVNTVNCLTIGARNTGTAAIPAITDVLQGAEYVICSIPSTITSAQKAEIRKLSALVAGVSGVV